MEEKREGSGEDAPSLGESVSPEPPKLEQGSNNEHDGDQSSVPSPSTAIPDSTGKITKAAGSAEKTESAQRDAKKAASPRRKPVASTGFAPSDINDGRERYEWRTKYDEAALKEIAGEKWYLFRLLYGVPATMFLIWIITSYLAKDYKDEKYYRVSQLAYAWLGGMLGGTLFDLKWLYHSVAKGLWHQDRSLWRFFTPHLSGALAFSFVLIISSNLIRLFDPTAFTSSKAIVAVAFLVGYFSDSAIAKLTEVAETLFGTTKKPKEKVTEEGHAGQALPPQASQAKSAKTGSGKTK